MRPTNTVRLSVIALSLGLYAASLVLPALQLRYHHEGMVAPMAPAIAAAPAYPPVLTPPPNPLPAPAPPPDPIITHVGWKMLLVSIAGPMDGNLAILANPLLLLGWSLFLMRRDRWAAATLGVALLFAMQTFQLRESGMYEDESGSNISYLNHPLIGWYLWVAAMLLPLAAALVFRRRSASS
jgi:hypothetical protein